MTRVADPASNAVIRRGTYAAWLVVVVGAVSSALFGVASGWNLGPGFHPEDYLTAGHADAFRWAALTDMFSYYLPFLLVVLAVHTSSDEASDPDRRTIAAAGMLYAVVGAIGAVLLATAGASLIEAHVAAGTPELAMVFRTLTEGVFIGIWQILEVVFAAVWWFGVARNWADSALLRTVGYMMAGAGIVTSAARMLQLDDLAWLSVLIFVVLWLPATLLVGLQLRRSTT